MHLSKNVCDRHWVTDVGFARFSSLTIVCFVCELIGFTHQPDLITVEVLS